MKNKCLNVILIIIIFAGTGSILYPTVSDLMNKWNASQVIAKYEKSVDDLEKENYTEMWQDAKRFNRKLAAKEYSENLTKEEWKEYNTLLDADGTGIMGYLEIERIGIKIPIYHGTESSVLQVAAGHMEWTSLPVGGKDCHCVIAAHSGLPSAKLFSNLESLEKEDRFVLHILDKTLVYEVDQIQVVYPEDIESLQIIKGKDYCTLVTCTPYGQNTHRLLVRGHRI